MWRYWIYTTVFCRLTSSVIILWFPISQKRFKCFIKNSRFGTINHSFYDACRLFRMFRFSQAAIVVVLNYKYGCFRRHNRTFRISKAFFKSNKIWMKYSKAPFASFRYSFTERSRKFGLFIKRFPLRCVYIYELWTIRVYLRPNWRTTFEIFTQLKDTLKNHKRVLQFDARISGFSWSSSNFQRWVQLESLKVANYDCHQ